MKKEPTDILLTQDKFVVLDFETTGLKPRTSRVIEIGMVKIVNAEITETFSSFVNPETDLPRSISMLTGINEEELSYAPKFAELAREIKQFIGDARIVAHNAPFDYAFLQNEFLLAELEPPQNETICTVKIARRLLPELKSKSLANLCKYFGIRNRNTHRALADAHCTAKMFLRMLPLLEENFGIKTGTQLAKFQNIPQKGVNFKFAKKSLMLDLASAPDSPGVYFFKDRHGEIIYVGKAKSLKKRLTSYFFATADRKAKKITRKAKNIEFIRTNTELTALLAETKFVKKYNPEFNSQLKKFPQTHFIKIDIAKKFPRPKIVAQIKSDGADYFGPYRNRETAGIVLETVNKAFPLRECVDPEFRRGKSCFLADIGRCIAPCVNPDEEIYATSVKDVYSFLSGENQNALNLLLGKMKLYSSQLRFEEAAEMRNTVQGLLTQLKRTAILAEPVNKANAVVEIQGKEKHDYLIFSNGAFYVKNDISETRDYFMRILDDYYSGTINYDMQIKPETTEYFKIALAWLNSHRDVIKIYYLKNYSSKEELFADMNNFNS